MTIQERLAALEKIPHDISYTAVFADGHTEKITELDAIFALVSGRMGQAPELLEVKGLPENSVFFLM